MIRENINKLADLQVIWHMSIALLYSVILIVIIITIIILGERLTGRQPPGPKPECDRGADR